MTGSTAILLFDGDCAFCSSCARLLVERVRPRDVAVTAWQHADLAALDVSQAEVDEAVVLVGPAGRRTHGPVAIADVLRGGGARGWRAVGAVLGTRPVLVVARPVYRWIARHRDRMPGGTPACAIPAAERTHPPT